MRVHSRLIRVRNLNPNENVQSGLADTDYNVNIVRKPEHHW